MANLYKCTDREKPMEIILTWTPSSIGMHNTSACITSRRQLCLQLQPQPRSAHSWAPAAPRLRSFFSPCATGCARSPCGQGWQAGQLWGRTAWGGGKSRERLSLASHWGHLLSPFPSHQDLAGTRALQPHSRSWSTMALHKQVPAAPHIFSYSCPGAFAELECILLW